MARIIACVCLQLLLAYTTVSTASYREYLRTLPECERVFRVCRQQFDSQTGMLEELSQVRQLLGNRTLLTRLVENLEDLSECRDRAAAMPGCEENTMLDDHSYIPVVADFLQSPGVMDNVMAVSSSPCLANEMNLFGLQRPVSQCIMGAQSAVDNGDVCSGIRNFLSCVERTVEQRCGQPAGNLFRRVRQYVFTRPELDGLVERNLGVDVSSCDNLATVVRRSAHMPRSLFNRFRK